MKFKTQVVLYNTEKFHILPLRPGQNNISLFKKLILKVESHQMLVRRIFFFLLNVGKLNERCFPLKPDLLSLTASTLIKASLIPFDLFSIILRASNGFHKAKAVISS